MQLPTIVFDLDGTLVETAPDLVDTLNVVFEREGIPPVPFDEARTFVGHGARAMITRGLDAEGRTVTPQILDKLFNDFVDYYTAHVADRSYPFPGVIEALDALSERGYRLAVCTNKFEKQSLLLLDALKMTSRFAAIVGQDTFKIAKPDPEVLRRTILTAGGDPAHAVMIGDSETDILTARAAALPVVAVDFGYSERPVSEYSPDRLISHFAQLSEAIAGLSPSK
ncbi:HAD family hydrolase [Undibacter mobilis]|uniref:Phosphoglycolate phosphatase n=1 Tax=Undibacter mobilis TaxID=2292256 RepID=A0A371B320_9BRAD|nr:HAD family hydrolase [Undibacter mobilis]RDV01968.1 phosphoglycolate phosphatase [Undibacter mobilis]